MLHEISKYALPAALGLFAFCTAGIIILFNRSNKVMRAKDATLANLREAYKTLEATKPLRELGQSVAFINHEIKNYMMVISGYTALLLKSKTLDEKDRAMIDNISQTAAKMHDLNMGVLEQSKSKITHDNKEFDLTQKLNSAIDVHFPKQTYNFDRFCGAPDGVILINGTPEKIERMFICAFQNSLEAAAQKIKAKLYVYNYMALAVIDDDGIGCDTAEQLANLSTTFFTTKQSAGGLGLSLIRSIIEAHGGSLNIYSKNLLGKNERGLSMQIVIPASKRTPYTAARSDVMVVKNGLSNAGNIMGILKNLKIIPHVVNKPEEIDFASRSSNLNLVILTAPAQAAGLKAAAGDKAGIKILPIEEAVKGTLFVNTDIENQNDDNKTLFTEEYIVRCLSGE